MNIKAAVKRFVRRKRLEALAEWFDAPFYLRQLGDRDEPRYPLEHYLDKGWRDGLDPHVMFSTDGYLEDHPDIAAAGVNPLEHYLIQGRDEARVVRQSAVPEADRLALQARIRDHFDPDFYLGQLPAPLTDIDPFKHFMTLGWNQGFDPNEHFSVKLYLEANPDVAERGMNPLEHYLTTGLEEGRAAPRVDPETIGERGKSLAFWREHAPESVLAIRHDYAFDPVFYTRAYDDVPREPLKAAAHYAESGAAEGRAASAYDLVRDRREDIDKLLDEVAKTPAVKSLLKDCPNLGAYCLFELIALGAPADRQVSTFSCAAYLEMYPDVAEAGVPPWLHYASSGRAEGRQSVGDLEDMVTPGAVTYDSCKPSVLLCVHELSKTGAPYVGLRLAEAFAPSHNVFIGAIKGGPLESDAAEHSVAVFISEHPDRDIPRIEFAPEGGFAGVIANSVESEAFVKYAVRKQIPALSYIHEYTEYTRPVDKCIRVALHSDHIIFSSENLRDSWTGVMKDVGMDIDADTSIFAQEELVCGAPSKAKQSKARAHIERRLCVSLKGRRLVYGAGHIQMRKGVDLFASAAVAAARSDPGIVFVWIGDGMNWDDLTYGAWLETQVERLAADNLFFLPSGQDYEALCTAADALFLSSRLDPLPNVVFDAVRAGAQIVLFENASGFDSPAYHREQSLHFAGHMDVARAAEILVALPRKLDTAPQRTERLKSRAANYRRLAERMAALLRDRNALYAGHDAEALGAAELDYGTLFVGSDRDPMRARVAERARMALTGRRYVWKSVSHFDEVVKAARDSGDSVIDFSVHHLTHSKSRRRTGYSVHCHAYYPDDLDGVLEAYPPLQKADRLLFTTDTESKAEMLEATIENFGLKHAEILVRPNRGRDILPFLECLADPEIAGVGDDDEEDASWLHIHLKRSNATTDSGRAWRDYMLTLLVGDERGLSNAARLINEPDTGLVTPFDPFCIGWGRSRRLLDKVSPRFEHQLPRTLLTFPVGNMFWAKRSVVCKMYDVFGEYYLWPQEPIPTDGTEYHLIERLWPSAAHELDLKTRLIFDQSVGRV